MQSQTHRPRPGQARSRSHSVRCTEDLWSKVNRQAASDGVTTNYAITEILEGYARGMKKVGGSLELGAIKTREAGQPRGAGHSIACTDELWNASKRQASLDQLTMNDILVLIMDGYARGTLSLPRVMKSFA